MRFAKLGLPPFFVSVLTDGLWRVLATVVSVMLPPMAIFFPLFTLLEDAGYLPRVAFFDHAFQCESERKQQSLTMCMGFGVQRLRRVAAASSTRRGRRHCHLTNSFAPCNGRFPLLIFLCSVFFAGSAAGGALLLTGVIAASVGRRCSSRILSATVFARRGGVVALELPPYRMPQIGRRRSVRDRTVRPKAAAVAAPARAHLDSCQCADREYSYPVAHHAFLDPAARVFGIDGVILLAFIPRLFPANELVMPLIVMGYLSSGTIASGVDFASFRTLLLANGWTVQTALCTPDAHRGARAVLDNLPYHPAGDAQRKVDTGGGADSCGSRACPLHTDTLHVYTDRLKKQAESAFFFFRVNHIKS